MKAGSKRFFEALCNGGIALTIVMMVAAAAAASDFQAQPAYAQGLEAQSQSGSGAALLAADSGSAAADIRTPSGIAAVDAQSSGALTATSTRRWSSSATASATGWKSAVASWYGPGFYGNTMASGEILTQTSMVVAHRTLPFGTRIQFSFKGRTCVAVVMDRGPFGAGRTFDLGPGTAKALGFSGVATVQYRIL